MVEIGNTIYEKLSFWEQYADDVDVGIPKKGGIYYWVYWPEFDSEIISLNDLETKLKEFTTKSLMFSETIVGNFKFHAVISEQSYPTHNDTVFGLSNSKHIKLLEYLEDRKNLKFFSQFFQEVCFARPFYIGKADNLFNRLVNQHFKKRSSNILEEVQGKKIPHTDIWVGYKIIESPKNSNINNIFEEIFSRRIKPGLTKKAN